MKKALILTLLLISPLFLTGCDKNISIDISDTWDKIKDLDIAVNQSDAMHVVVVPGYGAPVEGNSGYEGYIEDVAEFVGNEKNEVDAVVFTGSYSSLKSTSEAESMNDYFDSVSSSDVDVYKEECAIVSWQNMANTKDLLAEKDINTNKITVFGDIARKEKLLAYATFKFNQDSDVETNNSTLSLSYTDIDFEGYNFGTNQTEQEALIAAEMAGAYDAEVGNAILEKRIDDWTDQFGYDVADNLVAKGCSEFKGFK